MASPAAATIVSMVKHGKTATFRFYAELNDFLEPEQRGREFPYAFSGRPGIKDAIEALGVPHPEVELIVVGGKSVGFDLQLDDGDRVAVYPMFEAVDVSPLVRLREHPLRRTRFVLDTHLGKLARLLRLLGFDTLYRNDYNDPEIVRISIDEHRIALTRDRGILKHRELTHGYCVRSDAPMDQIREVVTRFDLGRAITPFSRCMMCNSLIQLVKKDEVEPRLLPGTRREHDEFRYCPGCDRIYWKGSHYTRLRRLVERLFPVSQQ
jgi:uncharacterized protein with PIN domain